MTSTQDQIYTLAIEIMGLPKMTNATYCHWRIRKKDADFWKKAVFVKAYPKRPDAPLKKAKITVTRYSSRCPDWDGLVSGFKHVIDGLRYAKVIIDDSYDVIGQPDFKWEKASRGGGKIKVEVAEVK